MTTKVPTVMTGAGGIIQVQQTLVTAYMSGTAFYPFDNTPPLITEGWEVMGLDFTPKFANSKLLVMVVVQAAAAAAHTAMCALHKVGTPESLATSVCTIGGAGWWDPFQINHFMTAGQTTPITFKVRVGGNSASAIYVNGDGQNRFGSTISSTLTVMEIAQ